MHPTIVLVHGAFADSSSWDGVVDTLIEAGHPVIAAANPLRGLASDAAGVSDLVRTIDGPVVLVGHSYGGAVITNVDPDAGQIVALVYVAAFAPKEGESAFQLSEMFPGSTLGSALRPVPRADGTTDLSITPERFHDQFAADVPEERTARMAITQRPVTQEALVEPSGARPLWKERRPGSSSARRTATSRARSSTTWPSAPRRTAPSRSRAPRTRSPSRTPPRPPARSCTRPTRTSPRDSEAVSRWFAACGQRRARANSNAMLIEKRYNGRNQSQMPTRVTLRELTPH